MRGEYIPWSEPGIRITELPPRARRIPPGARYTRRFIGTTSACAENTAQRITTNLSTRNYLRVRGEYGVDGGGAPNQMELPPRARRIRPAGFDALPNGGTTSACAENTALTGCFSTNSRNYLRVRGEYRSCLVASSITLELPPRARRIRPPSTGAAIPLGTTSACAENTGATAPVGAPTEELPPRARRIPSYHLGCPRCCGTTSACAENTTAGCNSATVWGNYLRVRGEYERS